MAAWSEASTSPGVHQALITCLGSVQALSRSPLRGDTGGSTSSCWLEMLRQPSQQQESGLLPEKHTLNSVTCIIRGGEAQGTTKRCGSTLSF